MNSTAILFRNLFDDATLQASNSLLRMPVDNLKGEDVATKYRSLSGSASILIDLGSVIEVDTFALIGLTAETVRCRVSETDPSGVGGEVLDETDTVDQRYSQSIFLLPAAIPARYVLFDLYHSTMGYVEAGRGVIGAKSLLSRNPSYNWGRGYVDLSIRTRMRGGQLRITEEPEYRTLSATFENLNEADYEDIVEAIDRENGTHKDVLFISDVESDNLARNSLWGLMADIGQVIEPYFQLYTKTYNIEERL